MSCNTYVTRIVPTEYIGNSLETINQNFENLKAGVTTNCTNILSAANVLGNLQTIANTIQSYTAGRAKAWVTFDATKDADGVSSTDPGLRYVINSYNIMDVYRYSSSPTGGGTIGGVYDINFVPEIHYPESETGEYPYGVIVTSGSVAASNGLFTWGTPIEYYNDRTVIRVTDGQQSPNYADPNRISVLIF